MRAFVDLYLALDATNSTADKTRLIVEHLASADASDAAWCVGLLAGHRPKGGASSAALKRLAIERSGLPDWLLSECRAAVGDLSETLALIVPKGKSLHTPLSLTETIDRYVLPLPTLDEGQRATVIGEAWDRFDAEERFVYHKLIRGGFRVGVGTGLLSKAIAEVAKIPRELVQHRLAANFTPTAAGWRELTSADDGDRVGPYPFYLAHQIDRDPMKLGERGRWHAEWKWDGIRAQLVKRGGIPTLWSRTGEPITRQFPEIVAAARTTPDGSVLDGEILLLGEESRPKPFASLQRRLNRKTAPSPQLGLFTQELVVFRAFDALEVDARDLRERPLKERLPVLDEIVNASGDAIDRSKPVDAADWPGLAKLRDTSREHGVEGLMLKDLDAPYGVGRAKDPERGAAWWKWKIDPYTADLILTTAYPGSGRRASLYTDYGFSTPGPGGELVQVTRAYSGLDNEEIESLDAWIRTHTTARHGPVRSVEPTRVFEIAFEGIARSDRHKAGVALRFPRILRERHEKAPSQATGLDELETLVRLAETGLT